MPTLRRIGIEGFKSIANAHLTLQDLNVVIGANESGKSNLIAAIKSLENIDCRHLQSVVAGDPDRLLHHGRQTTPVLVVAFDLGIHAYEIGLGAETENYL
jgi:predicted ATPase